MSAINNVEKFRFWCHKIIPLVYDDSLSYYEFLCKVMQKLNETIDTVNSQNEAISAFEDMFVNEYSTDSTYDVGDLVTENGKLWECIEPVTYGQAFNPNYWRETVLTDEWVSFKTFLTTAWNTFATNQESLRLSFEHIFVEEYEASKTYHLGDFCTHEGKLYVANATTTGTWDSSKWSEEIFVNYINGLLGSKFTELDQQYDDFLEAYQRQFGVANAFGNSTTDAISQDFFTKNTLTYKGQYTASVGTDVLDTTAPVGLYGASASQAATLTNTPPEFKTNKQAFIWVIYTASSATNCIRIIFQEGTVFLHNRGWQIVKVTESFGDSDYATVSQNFFTINSLTFKGYYTAKVGTNATDNAATPGLYGVTVAQASDLTNLPEGYDTSLTSYIWVPNALLRVVFQKNNLFTYCAGEWQTLGRKWGALKWAAVGDSLTEVNIRAEKNYISYITENTGISCTNYGVSGSGYKKDEGSNKAFYQRILNIGTDFDVITIFGSGNDLNIGSFPSTLGDVTDTGTTTICGCINQTLDNLLNLYLTAGKVPQIGIIAPTPWYTSNVDYTPANTGNKMEQYVTKLEQICERKGIPFLDLYHTSNLHPENATFRTLAYSNDGGNGIHPDDTGHKIIASRIEEFLRSLIIE